MPLTRQEEMWYNEPSKSFEEERRNMWRTANGTYISVCDMTDSHLLNAFNKFQDEMLFQEMVYRLFKQRVEGSK